MNGLALKALAALTGLVLAGAVAWVGWATDTLIEHSVALARMETKLDYLIDPNAKAVAHVGSNNN